MMRFTDLSITNTVLDDIPSVNSLFHRWKQLEVKTVETTMLRLTLDSRENHQRISSYPWDEWGKLAALVDRNSFSLYLNCSLIGIITKHVGVRPNEKDGIIFNDLS